MQTPPLVIDSNTSGVVKKRSDHKGWTIFLSILFGLSLFFTLLFIPMKATFFNPNYYDKVFSDHDLYRGLSIIIAESIQTKLVAQDADMFVRNISRGDLENLIITLLPNGWLELQTQSAIWFALDFLNLNSDDIYYLIDLHSIKQNLNSPAAQQAIVAMINGLPQCSGEQMNLILAAIQLGEGGITFCNPPVSDLPVLELLINPVTAVIDSKIPDAIQIPSDTGRQYLQNFRSSGVYNWYWYFRKSMDILPWVSLALGLLILASSFRRVKLTINGLGIPLVISGFLSAIPAAWVLLNRNILAIQFVNLSGFAEMKESSRILFEIVQDGLFSACSITLAWTLGAILIGLALLVIGFMVKNKD